MEKIVLQLSPKEYAAEMRHRVRLFPSWEGDCFSGIVIGRFFSVSYRTYYDWDKRTSYACCRAMGFVGHKEGTTVVSYITTRGLFSLFWICFVALLYLIPTLIEPTGMFWMHLCFAFIISIILCAVTALIESLRDSGDEAARTIRRFVKEPNAFVGHEKEH